MWNKTLIKISSLNFQLFKMYKNFAKMSNQDIFLLKFSEI